jgi:hypothetical protein
LIPGTKGYTTTNKLVAEKKDDYGAQKFLPQNIYDQTEIRLSKLMLAVKLVC